MPYQSLTLPEFASRFATPEACLEAIIQRRWPAGWKCSHCGGGRHHRLRTRRALPCASRSCRRQSSITAGTVWKDVPDTWACPDCGVAKADFEVVEI